MTSILHSTFNKREIRREIGSFLIKSKGLFDEEVVSMDQIQHFMADNEKYFSEKIIEKEIEGNFSYIQRICYNIDIDVEIMKIAELYEKTFYLLEVAKGGCFYDHESYFYGKQWIEDERTIVLRFMKTHPRVNFVFREIFLSDKRKNLFEEKFSY